MTKYTATFSTGETFTRKSEHAYKTAAAWVNQETGKIKNITFSKSTNPTPSIDGVFNHTRGAWVYGLKPRRVAELEAENQELAKIWKLEVVQLAN